MGLRFGVSSSTFDKPKERIVERVVVKHLPNPNPYNYVIKNDYQTGDYLIILINYPDCTNYEGNKVLVYKNVHLRDLINQGSIDPHFSNNKSKHSPIARFVPTEDGWNMAMQLVSLLNKST